MYTKKEGDKGYDHIPFHKHIEVMHPHIYHGFYCANVEPSTTTYRIGPEQPESEWVVHQDYDDMLIYSASGFEHASSPWMEDKPRVTIAFDIFPESIYFGEQDTDYDWSLDGRMYHNTISRFMGRRTMSYFQYIKRFRTKLCKKRV